MKAVVWHGKEDIRVDHVADPRIEEPTDAIIRITSTGLCGSDLHLYSKLGMFMTEGDIIGHEPMGIVEEVGAEVTQIAPGDRVVVPFNIACGHCLQCQAQMYSQCETTQVREHAKGAALFGYTKLYGQVPGRQAEYLRVPQAQFGPIKVPHEAPDTRWLYLSDVLPTAWQAVDYAAIPPGGSVAVYGLGPIGQMSCRIALHRGAGRVFGIDFVPERLAMAAKNGVEILDSRDHDDVAATVVDLTSGRGADAVIDAVGMEAESGKLSEIAQTMKFQMDRLEGLRKSFGTVKRGGIVSIIGVYVGLENAFPLGDLFDKQITLRMGQANVRRWVDDLMPLLTDADPLGTGDLATHLLPLDQAPHAYEIFQKKQDGAIKIIFQP
jgi:threonine dehydrogenase-like Zn-dependent dehydrogenase